MLTTVDAGTMLGYGRDTVRKLIEEGYFPGAYRRPGGQYRIPRADVLAFKAKMSGDPDASDETREREVG